MQFKVVHRVYDRGSFLCCGEVGKSQTPENTIVKVIVEGIRERQAQVGHDLYQLLLLHCKWDVFDYNGRRDKLLVNFMRKIILSQRVPEALAGVARAQSRESKTWKALRLVEPPLIEKGMSGLATDAFRRGVTYSWQRASAAPRLAHTTWGTTQGRERVAL